MTIKSAHWVHSECETAIMPPELEHKTCPETKRDSVRGEVKGESHYFFLS